MNAIKSIFWNSQQGRIRTLWRLILQLAITVVIVLPFQFVLGIVAAVLMVRQSGISLDQITGPEGQEAFSPQAMQQFITQSPIIMTLTAALMLVAVVVSVWIAGRFLDRRRFADFGFHFNANWWIDLGFGLFLGAALIALVIAIELALGWLSVTGTFVTREPDATFWVAILPPLFNFLAVGIYEELFSRGYHTQNLVEGFNWDWLGPRGAIIVAVVISSAVFGLLHATNPNASPISTFNITVAGALLLGIGYLLTGELAIPIGVHITWNFFQGNVFGCPVSGVCFNSATFIAVEQGGPNLWTGGDFGPEAGLLGLIAMILGGLLTILWVRWRYGEAGLHLPLAEPPERTEA